MHEDSGVLRTLADIPGRRSGPGTVLVSNREEVGLIFENKRTISRHTFVVLSISITFMVFAKEARLSVPLEKKLLAALTRPRSAGSAPPAAPSVGAVKAWLVSCYPSIPHPVDI